LSPTMELDASYSALIFIGQHAMAGAEKGVLTHIESWDGIQNVWVNNRPTGEIGVMTPWCIVPHAHQRLRRPWFGRFMNWSNRSATKNEGVNSVGTCSLSELNIFQPLVQVGL